MSALKTAEEQAVSGLTQPTARYTLFGGEVQVLVFGRPANYAGLSNHQNTNQPALETIAGWAASYGVLEVFAPSARDFNARVVDPDLEHFTQKREMGSVVFRTGVSADGVLMHRPKSAFFIASADCPTLILRLPNGKIVAAHAGRDCLIDRGRLSGGSPSRMHESVVFAATSHYHGEYEKIQSVLICGIGPTNFFHFCGRHSGDKVAAFKNRQMISDFQKRWGHKCVLLPIGDGRLNLYEAVKGQLDSVGVPTDRTSFFHDHSDTFRDRLADGSAKYHSHRRDKDGCRNGVLVVRL